MIPVANPITEPPTFEVECRRKGKAWLAKPENAGKTTGFPDHWNRFNADLDAGFHSRCGYWAMRIQSGTVDHFFSKAKPANRDLIYEWSNYRYSEGTVNGSKKNHDNAVLDPFEVGIDWFEVLLPSMQLICTSNVPAALRAKAEFTLKVLHLADGAKIRRNRKRWYEDHKECLRDPNKGLTIGGLKDAAPLVAEAVKKWQATGQPLP